jgi:hypothetical protein
MALGFLQIIVNFGVAGLRRGCCSSPLDISRSSAPFSRLVV